MAARRRVTGRTADGKGHVVSGGPAPCVPATEEVPGFQTVQNGTVHGWRTSSHELEHVACAVLGAKAAEASSSRDEMQEAAR
ncbi:hypothetical protein [Streptomyces himalayensis]|uniref:hypothetical protein n=1 Tax=Streptomyces himalayensis TaxID=2820085 RepID=UPI001C697090|nr:hypothetical protein [Streptomyces himalayensis]